ncbi:aminotransferase class III-fold pyridoxal phosphate-dependent enzyme [Escherichia coli]
MQNRAGILCLGKALTGGTIPLSRDAHHARGCGNHHNGEAGCFMHGPTFMGNPLACAAANASLAISDCDSAATVAGY